MNNFNLPAHELFAGKMTWFGAKQLRCEPSSVQDESLAFTTQDWPSMSHRTDSANMAFVSHLSRLLLGNNRALRLHHADVSAQTVVDPEEFTELFGSVIEDGWMGVDEMSINRWRFLGLSERLVVRALASQRHEKVRPYAQPERGPITVTFRPFAADAALLIAASLQRQ